MKIEKILIIADDTPPSAKAIEYGFNLARKLNAKAILLSVVDPANAMGDPDAGVFPDDALIASKARSETFLTAMQKEYGEGVDTELLVPVGDIQATIVKIAVNYEANLIVAGTHGRTGLSRLFSGSVAESIIHASPVPVLIVPK